MNCPNCKAGNAEDARFCGTCGHTLSATEASNPKLAAQGGGVGEAPSLIGREIAGRYRILAKLGEGGMGAVYKAEQMSLKRTCAVKVLRPEVAGSQMLLRRFNAEAELVAKLNHPNIVGIYDFGQDTDGSLFIAMEFIEGKSLRTVIHHGAPLPLRRSLTIASQICASLVEAHTQGIVHRDLKPDNVMLQDRGRQKDVVRVLDFGIAKLRDENRQSQLAMTQAGDMLGTPQYMSPEQIRGEHIDGRTDIYALGGLLYEMVTGRLPFEAPTVMALLSKHLLEQIVPPSQRRPDLNLPTVIDQLILGAMAKDVNQRPATMEQFGEQIQAVLSQLPYEPGQTAQATAQQPAMTRPQSVPTPSAAYAAGPGGAVLQSGGFAPPSMPPPGGPAPQHPMTPPPGIGTPPPPQGYPPMHGQAAAYDPYANAQQVVPQPAKSSGGGKGIYIVLALLVLGGIGIGVYFATKKDGGGGGTAGSDGSAGSAGSGGSAVAAATPDAAVAAPPPKQTPDAAEKQLGSADDPWNKGGSGATGSDDTTGGGDDDGAGGDDEPTPTPKGNWPVECETYAKAIEQLAKCKQFPAQSRQAMLDAVKQMRQGYANVQLTPDIKKQLVQACTQGASAIKQAVGAYGCGGS